MVPSGSRKNGPPVSSYDVMRGTGPVIPDRQVSTAGCSIMFICLAGSEVRALRAGSGIETVFGIPSRML